jgi:hypothetical protein
LAGARTQDARTDQRLALLTGPTFVDFGPIPVRHWARIYKRNFELPPMQWTQEQVKEKLAQLELEHRDLDDVIQALMAQQDFDQLKVSRLKKRKLSLKDQISSLRNQLIPDIIA